MHPNKLFILCLAIYLMTGVTAVAQSWESWLQAKSSEHPKISKALQSFLGESHTERDSFALELTRYVPLYDFYRQGDRVRVVIELDSDKARSQIVNTIREHGGEIELFQGAQIQAILPATRLTQIADLDEVQFIRPPVRPSLDQGTIISEGRRLIGAPT